MPSITKSLLVLLVAAIPSTFFGQPDEVVGALPGEVFVDSFGRANYEIPIAVPPGTAGMEPDLSLIYNSGSGNGLLGVGWSIGGLSAIAVGPKTLIHDGEVRGIKLDGDDPFYLDGQRLIHINGERDTNGDLLPDQKAHGEVGAIYRTEIDNFADIKIVSASEDVNGVEPGTGFAFRVRTKDGLVMHYGWRDNSHIRLDLSAVGKDFTWALTRIADTSGNYIDFDYEDYGFGGRTGVDNPLGEQGVYRIDKVRYTGHSGSPIVTPYAEVDFEYQARSEIGGVGNDTPPTYVADCKLNSNSVLKDITVTSNTQYVRHYEVVFERSPITDRIRLIEVKQFTGNQKESPESSLPQISISYQNVSPENALVELGDNSYPNRSDDELWLNAELNGDGRPELMRYIKDGNIHKYWIYHVSSNSSTVSVPDTHSQYLEIDLPPDCVVALGDYNGDGLTDMAYHGNRTRLSDDSFETINCDTRCVEYEQNGPEHKMEPECVEWETIFKDVYPYEMILSVRFGNGLGGFGEEEDGWIVVRDAVSDSNGIAFRSLTVGDFDGDGRDEICAVTRRSAGGCNTTEEYWLGMGANQSSIVQKSGTAATHGTVGDYDGDGRQDIFRFWSNPIASTWQIAFSVSSLSDDGIASKGPFVATGIPVSNGTYHPGSEWFHGTGDFNGDGLTDIFIRYTHYDDEHYKIYLSTGSSFIESTAVHIGHKGRIRSELFLDFNGDGMDDWIRTVQAFDFSIYVQVHLSNGVRFSGSPLSQHKLRTGLDWWSVRQVIGGGDYRGIGAKDVFLPNETPDGRTELSVFGLMESELRSDLMASVVKSVTGVPIGDSIYIEYGPITDSTVYVKGSGAQYPIQDFQAPMHVVSKLSKNDGVGGSYESIYTYANGRNHLRGKGFLGFQIFETYDPQKRVSQIQVTAQDFPFTGMVLRTENCYWPEGGTSNDPVMISQTDNFLFAERVDDSGFGGVNCGETIFPMILKSTQRTWHVDDDGTTVSNPGTGDPWSIVTTRNLFDNQIGTVDLFPVDPADLSGTVDTLAAGPNPWKGGLSTSEAAAYNLPEVAGVDRVDGTAPSGLGSISSANEAWAEWIETPHVPANITHGNMVWVDVEYGNSGDPDYARTTTANLFEDDRSGDKHHLGRLVWSEVKHQRPEQGIGTDSSTGIAGRTVDALWTDQTAVVRKTAFAYDTTTGLLTDEWVEPDGSPGSPAASDLGSHTFHHRDAFGNITKMIVNATGENSRESETIYDSIGRFPTAKKNVYGHTETPVYDPLLGVLKRSTGPNGLITEWEYDAFGRVEKETSFFGLSNAIDVTTDREWSSLVIPGKDVPDPETPGLSISVLNQTAYTVTTTSSPEQPTAMVFADVLGREIRTANEHPGSNGGTKWVIVDTFYNALGQVIAVSDPYILDGDPKIDSGNPANEMWSTHAYDKVGRPTFSYSSNGSRSKLEYGLDEVSLNPGNGLVTINRPRTRTLANYVFGGTGNQENQTATAFTDIQGNDLRIVDYQGGTLTFWYDAVGNLIQTDQAADGETITTETRFDSFGRKVWMNDPDMGVWTYQYDAFGQLTGQEDAAENVTRMVYDKLGRLKDRTTGHGTSAAEYTRWYYYGEADDGDSHIVVDPANGRIGELATVETSSSATAGNHEDSRYRQAYYFDSYKRPCMTLTKIEGQYYYTYTRYDNRHRTKYVDYFWRPTGEESLGSPAWQSFGLDYSYNGLGFNYSVKDRQGVTWWSTAQDASAVDAYGSLNDFIYGNGVQTVLTHSNFRRTINTVASTSISTVQDYTARFDVLGNLTERTMAFGSASLAESFTYDRLNRIHESIVAGQAALTHEFDAFGRIESRVRGPNTVIAVDPINGFFQGTHRLQTYDADDDRDGIASRFLIAYDGNGNMRDRIREGSAERWQAQWSAFNKLKTIRRYDPLTDQQNKVDFTYDASFQRVSETTHLDDGNVANPTARTRQIYHGALEQFWQESAAGSDNFELEYTKVYISTPVGVVGVFTVDRNATAATDNTRQYFHYDHLGSITAITNDAFVTGVDVLERMAFSVWGERRDPTDWSELAVGESYEDRYDTGDSSKDISEEEYAQKRTDRGFTGHEMMDGVNLVNMNGRVYDPLLGLFLSADPIVQAPENLQNYHRYSYVLNNPASFTDPTGHFWQIVVGAILAVIPGLNWVGAALIMAAMTAAVTYAQTGSLSAALKAGAISFAMAGVAAGVGSIFSETASLLQNFSWESLGTELARASAHGISGGAFAEMGGGDFSAGFAAGFAGSMGGSLVGDGLFGTNGDGDLRNMTLRTTTAAIIGGTAAELGGGKFANGAATAAVQHLFNAESDVWLKGKNPNPPDEIDVSMDYGNGVEELKKITDWQPGDTVIVSGDAAAFGEALESGTRGWRDVDHQAAHEEMFMIHPNGDVSNVGYSQNGVHGLDRDLIGDDVIRDYRFDSTALRFRGRDVTGQFYNAATDLANSQFTAANYRVATIGIGDPVMGGLPSYWEFTQVNNCQTFCTTMRWKAREF